MIRIKRALLSVSDKTNLVALAITLHEHGVKLISTGGTAKAIADAGVPVTAVSDVTSFPEIMGGRVKTLHPRIHGGILARRGTATDMDEALANGIEMIDMVVVNLYPFIDVIRRGVTDVGEALENIDIGGPCMIRAAAKNYPHVVVATSPAHYDVITTELKENKGKVRRATSRRLALAAFAHTSAYDSAIAGYLGGQVDESAVAPTRPLVSLGLERVSGLRYGENSHQVPAAIYREMTSTHPGLMSATQHQGKEMSYNNYLDFQAAWDIVREFDRPAAVLIKHNNPCGVAVADDHVTAFEQGLASDSVSAFGGVFAVNAVIDKALAEAIHKVGFFEGLIAPGYTEDALEILGKKKDRRLLSMPEEVFSQPRPEWEARMIEGGALLQKRDVEAETFSEWTCPTDRQPTDEERRSLEFAWLVAKHVKSNAIVMVQGTATVGIGAGQMSRVDATHLAARKAGEKAKGSALASDAFFPFRDGLDAAAEAGATAIVQPGGSIRDEEVIDAANEHGIAMLLTGRRHFKH